MAKNNPSKQAWTPQEEELIGLFMELIPILQEVKVDLESKNLLRKEFCLSREEPTSRPANR